VRIENEFVVRAPSEDVFAFLADVERVAPCMPGAEIVAGAGGADEYRGRFRIRVGPVSAAYEGSVGLVSQDPAEGRIVLRGSGADPRGAGSAEAVVTVLLAGDDGATSVRMSTDLDVSGRLAQFSGRSSLMQGVADRIVKDFARRLELELATPAPQADAAGDEAPPVTPPPAADAEPLDAGALLRDIAGGRAAWIAGAALFLAGVAVGLRARPARRGRRIELHF
jgi:uncharacterized protein